MLLSEYNERMKALEDASDEDLKAYMNESPENRAKIESFLSIDPNTLQNDTSTDSTGDYSAQLSNIENMSDEQLMSMDQSQLDNFLSKIPEENYTQETSIAENPIESDKPGMVRQALTVGGLLGKGAEALKSNDKYSSIPKGVDPDGMIANTIYSLSPEERIEYLDDYYATNPDDSPSNRPLPTSEELSKQKEIEAKTTFQIFGDVLGMIGKAPQYVADQVQGAYAGASKAIAGIPLAQARVINKIANIAGYEGELFPTEGTWASEFYKEAKVQRDEAPGSELMKDAGEFGGEVISAITGFGGPLALASTKVPVLGSIVAGGAGSIFKSAGGSLANRMLYTPIKAMGAGAALEAIADPDSDMSDILGAGVMTGVGKAAEPLLGGALGVMGMAWRRANPKADKLADEILNQFESDPFTKQSAKIEEAATREGTFTTPFEKTGLPDFKKAQEYADPNLQLRVKQRNEQLEANINKYVSQLAGDGETTVNKELAGKLNQAIQKLSDDFYKSYNPIREKAFNQPMTQDGHTMIKMLMQADEGVNSAFLKYRTIEQNILKKSAEGKPLEGLELVLADDFMNIKKGTIGQYQIIKKIMDYDIAKASGGEGMNKVLKGKLVKSKEAYLEILDSISPEYKQSREMYTRWGFDPESVGSKDSLVAQLAKLDLSNSTDVAKFNRIMFNPDNRAQFNTVKNVLKDTPGGATLLGGAIKKHLNDVMYPPKGSSQDPLTRLYNKYLSNESAINNFKDMMKGIGGKQTNQKIDDYALLLRAMNEPPSRVSQEISGMFDLIRTVGQKDIGAALTDILTNKKWNGAWEKAQRAKTVNQRLYLTGQILYQAAIEKQGDDPGIVRGVGQFTQNVGGAAVGAAKMLGTTLEMLGDD